MNVFASLLLTFFLVSCSRAQLKVDCEYYDKQRLASSIVDSPDPRKNGSDYGQRLILNWHVTDSAFAEGPLELVLRVRLKDGEEKTSKILLKKRQGRTFYPIFGNDYTKRGGLQSYLAELKLNGKVIATSRHKLWVEKIIVQ